MSRNHLVPRVSAASLRPLHDARAWTTFFVLMVVAVLVAPFAAPASAQLPGLPLPVPTELPETNTPLDDLLPGGDDEEEEPDPEPSEDDGALPVPDPTAERQRKAGYYTSPTEFLLPATVVNEFPAGIVCVLVVQACTEEAEQITGPLGEMVFFPAVDGANTAGESLPQPVPPGALPVGLLNGNQRYSTAIDIPLPEVPEGMTFETFDVTLQLSNATFALESPAFRDLTTVILAQASETNPDLFSAYLEAVAAQETAAFTTDFPGLEMCVIKGEWSGVDNQPVVDQPEIDPLFCSFPAKPAEDGTVTFEMGFAASESLPGGLAPGWDGVLVRPLAAQNLAYGDADYTTNYYAYIENPDEFPPATAQNLIEGRVQVPTDEGAPATPAPSSGSSSSGGSSGGGFGGGSSGGGFGGGSSGGGFGGGSSGGSAAGATGGSPAADTGVGADESLPAAVEPAVDDAGNTLDPVPVSYGTSGYLIWLLLPMLLGGAVWYGRVLEVVPMDVVSRSGAMTRLLRERGFQI